MGRMTNRTDAEQLAAIKEARRRYYEAHKDEYLARVYEARRLAGHNFTGKRGRPKKAAQLPAEVIV